jgi:membrane-associated protein
MDFLIELIARLHDVHGLIEWGGYTALAIIIFAETGLFVGFFLPGDSLLVSAGLFAAKGDLNILILFGLLAVMAIIGDTTGYWFGRSTGPKIFAREKSVFFAKDHLLHAKGFYEKYGNKTIVIARFIPIIRTFAPIVAGVGEMSYARFITYNVLGGIGWIAAMLGIGFFLGRAIPNIESRIDAVILVVIFLSILPGIVEFVRARRKSRVTSYESRV